MYIYINMMLNIQIWIKCRVRTLKGTAFNGVLKAAKLAHRAAFLDFLVKSRLEPRNTASSTPKVGKNIAEVYRESPYNLRHLGREWLAIYKLTIGVGELLFSN